MHTLTLSYDDVAKQPMGHLLPFMSWNPPYITYMNELPGQEHYKLLANISHQLPDGAVISDVGTYFGASALALSSNPKVCVTTYDIADCITKNNNTLTPLSRENITQKIMPGQQDIELIAKSDLVVLDIDPHDGPAEIDFVKLLVEHGFRGILICDDINLNAGMKEFWNSIPSHLKKIDVSRLAHWTGTGLVVFDPLKIDAKYI